MIHYTETTVTELVEAFVAEHEAKGWVVMGWLTLDKGECIQYETARWHTGFRAVGKFPVMINPNLIKYNPGANNAITWLTAGYVTSHDTTSTFFGVPINGDTHEKENLGKLVSKGHQLQMYCAVDVLSRYDFELNPEFIVTEYWTKLTFYNEEEKKWHKNSERKRVEENCWWLRSIEYLKVA